ncbi:MAG: hypothetical protein KGL47_01805 [Acidobacteriota bacterium]|nr:hypothetical protein [Acidobacteriota bacterium]
MSSKSNLSFLRDKNAQRSWIALVIAWAVIRAVVIKDVFGDYGINGWNYFVVDLCSGIPYAVFSGRAVINFLDKDWASIRKNGFLSLIFFYIPDIYILIFAKQVPFSLLIGFLISIAVFTSFAIWGLRRDVAKGENK